MEEEKELYLKFNQDLCKIKSKLKEIHSNEHYQRAFKKCRLQGLGNALENIEISLFKVKYKYSQDFPNSDIRDIGIEDIKEEINIEDLIIGVIESTWGNLYEFMQDDVKVTREQWFRFEDLIKEFATNVIKEGGHLQELLEEVP